MSSVFETLNAINVNGHTEKKNGLTYLSWAWAWAEAKKAFPSAIYTIYENENGWNYFTDGNTCWVKTGVTIEGIENIEYLPIMDFKNKSIPLSNVTSMDVNKAIQRSLTKALARHGLGLYIYAGEDLPEGEEETIKANGKEYSTSDIESVGTAKITDLVAKAWEERIAKEEDPEGLKAFILKGFGVDSISDLTVKQASDLGAKWKSTVKAFRGE